MLSTHDDDQGLIQHLIENLMNLWQFHVYSSKEKEILNFERVNDQT